MSGLDLKLDASRDLALSSGDAVLVDGAERVRQGIGIALRIWRGEYFLNSDTGVPYLDTILVKNPSRASIEAALRSVIRDVDGVESVDSMSITIDRQARSLAVSFAATTGDGIVADTLLVE